MEQVESGHGFENVIQLLLIRLEQEELSPEPFRRHGIVGFFVGEHGEKMKIELDNLGLKRVWPQQVG